MDSTVDVSLAVILPTYNEYENLPILVNELITEFRKHNYDYEIIIVDDCSPDGTWRVAQDMEKRIEGVRLIIRKGEKGLASAIRAGIEKATKGIICCMDTDLSHTVKDIKRMMEYINDYDAVWASRYVKDGKMLAEREKRIQRFLSTVFNYYLKIFLRLPVIDTTNGFFIMKRHIFDLVDLDKVFVGYGDYTFKLVYFLKGKGVKMKEIPSIYEQRRHGKSKTRIINIALRYFVESLKIRFFQ